jgi:hypothetical protein
MTCVPVDGMELDYLLEKKKGNHKRLTDSPGNGDDIKLPFSKCMVQHVGIHSMVQYHTTS